MNTYKYRYRETVNGIKIDIKADTQKELSRKLEERKKTIGLVEQDLTMAELRERWLELKKPTVGDDTYKSYESYSKRFISNKRVIDMVQSDIQKIINDKQNMSKRHYHMIYLVANQMFKQAEHDRIIPYNPVKFCTIPNGSEHPRRAITDAEREIFLKASKVYPNSLPFLIMLRMGLRPSEVRRIKGKDIDVESKTLHIPKSKTDAGDRYIPIPDDFIFKMNGFRPNEYVVKDKNGHPINKDRLDRWWYSFRREMHIAAGGELFRNAVKDDVIAKDFTQYCLRHTYCTDLERAGVPLNVAKRLMGHKKIEITAKIYTHAHTDTFEDARAKINAAAKPKSKHRGKQAGKKSL